MGEQLGNRLAEPRRATRLIRLPEVMRRVGLGRSTIYRWMSEGSFPKPVQLGGHAVAWVEQEVEAWVVNKLNSEA
ncbi:AlpA family transcriptional regulator [uncultured Erythrobacter sp.]|uniref:helix-turn-helix transcriptional regulator n=1 Tax=uncultured Erythrobacter sp. TaxID=263913 RepID=UPI002627841C|nr:AlpA family transcriptional regulator [uncultured Erythrobacter sp.]